MQESWPACGGSTSVGTTFLLRVVEKSRSLATGASNTILLGELQVGAPAFGHVAPPPCPVAEHVNR